METFLPLLRVNENFFKFSYTGSLKSMGKYFQNDLAELFAI
jgi:hypothetical protein